MAENQTEVSTYEPPPGESQEYIQQMVDKAEQANNPQITDVDFQGERPEWLPDKFKSPEDLVKSYQALEQKLGGQSQQEPSDPELPDEYEAVDQGLQEAEQAVENAGLDFEVLANEYAENGELSQEAYQALQESGIPKNLVNQFIEGQEAKTQLMQREAYSLVGGEQQYNEMINWASNNLSEQEIEAFNNNLSTQDTAQTNFAIKGLYTQYAMSQGVAPNLVQGTGQARQGGFQSVAQLKEAMKDPKYKADPAYRNEVMQKLSVSNIM